MKGILPEARQFHSMTHFNSKLFLFGGEASGREDFKEFNEIFELDLGRNESLGVG